MSDSGWPHRRQPTPSRFLIQAIIPLYFPIPLSNCFTLESSENFLKQLQLWYHQIFDSVDSVGGPPPKHTFLTSSQIVRLLVWRPHVGNPGPNSFTCLDYFTVSLFSPQLMNLILIFSNNRNQNRIFVYSHYICDVVSKFVLLFSVFFSVTGAIDPILLAYKRFPLTLSPISTKQPCCCCCRFSPVRLCATP